MAKKINLIYVILAVIIFLIIAFSFSKKKNKLDNYQNLPKQAIVTTEESKKDVLVTFIELGSKKCIPCKMMQPVMAEIQERYRGQVKVIFYDVWTEQGKPYADKYKINTIPTQVFLDKDGKEFFRHQGFFSVKEIEKILKTKGIKINA